MTLEESREVIPMMESMINQDRGTAEAYGRDGTGIAETGQAASVLSGAEPEFADIKQRVILLLNLLPDTEELLSQIEQLKNRIEQLENEKQQWQELTQKP